jgi:hypothetical protein
LHVELAHSSPEEEILILFAHKDIASFDGEKGKKEI